MTKSKGNVARNMKTSPGVFPFASCSQWPSLDLNTKFQMLSDMKLRIQNGHVQITQMGQKSIRFASRIIQNQASIHFDVDVEDLPCSDGFFSSTIDPYFIVYDGNTNTTTRGNINPNEMDKVLFTSCVKKNAKNGITHWRFGEKQTIEVKKFSTMKWAPNNSELQFRFRFSFFDKDKDGEDDFLGADKKDWDLYSKPHLGCDFDLKKIEHKICARQVYVFQKIQLHRKVKSLFGSAKLKHQGRAEVRFEISVSAKGRTRLASIVAQLASKSAHQALLQCEAACLEMLYHRDNVAMYASNIAQVASMAAVHASARCDGVVTLAKTNRQQFLIWTAQAIQNAALVALTSASASQKALINLDSFVVAAIHRRAEISKCVRTIVFENRRQAYTSSMKKALEISNAKQQSYV